MLLQYDWKAFMALLQSACQNGAYSILKSVTIILNILIPSVFKKHTLVAW